MKDQRIAWLYPSISFGAYWQSIMVAFQARYQKSVFYTGCVWPHFDRQDPKNKAFQIIGKTRYVVSDQRRDGYRRAFIYASPTVFWPLLKFRPDIIFASAFSVWTIIAVLLKPVAGWKIAIMYDGSTPNSDFQDSKLRSYVRKITALFVDAFISNSQMAQKYLVCDLGIPEQKVFLGNYLVPDSAALLRKADTVSLTLGSSLKPPIFLFVGQVIERKGIHTLLSACVLLKQQGYESYGVMIVGDGEAKADLEAFVRTHELEDQVTWAGWVEYENLGVYFQQTDVFVFPTYEDVWGMVVLEAMVFGKPILCSHGANASEMVLPGENGYIFDPGDVDTLALHMKQFIENPQLIKSMGQCSQMLIDKHTPEEAAQHFSDVVSYLS